MVTFQLIATKSLLGRDAAWIVHKTLNTNVSIVMEAEGRTTETDYYKELRLMSLVGLGIREGSRICVKVEGENEEIIAVWLESELKNRL